MLAVPSRQDYTYLVDRWNDRRLDWKSTGSSAARKPCDSCGGLRTALPIAVGMSAMMARRYLALDLIAAAVWSTVIACIGFGAMRVLTRWIADLLSA
jgi:hypothetical protein